MKLVIANWKMNGSRALAREWLAEWDAVRGEIPDSVRAVICPPFPFLGLFSGAAERGFALGGQDCSALAGCGARTGEVSAEMLAELGCEFALVGHSERRRFFGEDGESCAAKIRAARAAGLTPVLCVGETAEQRRRGQTAETVRGQLRAALGDSQNGGKTGSFGLVVGYEPVWAIGGGGTPGAAEIAAAHAAVGDFFRKNGRAGGKCDIIRTVYGGSVGASNAVEIFAVKGVDGALVGGASLNASDFARVCRAAGMSFRH